MNDRISEIRSRVKSGKEYAFAYLDRKIYVSDVDALLSELDRLTAENRAQVKIMREMEERLSTSQRREKAARNELCLKCGLYHEAHNGACDGCRWKEN